MLRSVRHPRTPRSGHEHERFVPVEETAFEVPQVTLPPSPPLPPFDLPAFPELPAARLPGPLDVVEASVTGAPARLNAFDQNVPGFSVTFLLLGMLLGVSLGLLDERDWGTLERLRAMPAPFAATLVAKLLARFLVGLAQMIALFAVGRLVFGSISERLIHDARTPVLLVRVPHAQG